MSGAERRKQMRCRFPMDFIPTNERLNLETIIAQYENFLKSVEREGD